MGKYEALRARIEDVGNTILGSCHREDGRSGPIMIPPIPESKFFDKLPEGPLEGPNLQEKEHQDAYEAEVKLYRQFEEIEGTNLVVIHQLDYTHEQYFSLFPKHLCQKKNCKKGPDDHPCHKQDREIEGECDFVVLGDNFLAVFEVKGLRLQKTRTSDDKAKLAGCRDSALTQRQRMRGLIESIDRSVNESIDPSVTILDFTVFPNISTGEMGEMSQGSDERELFSDDLDNFTHWFDQHITSTVTDSGEISTKKVQHFLLGLWCMSAENKYDIQDCCLSKCIKAINDKLCRALLTKKAVHEEEQSKKNKGKKKQKTKKYPENAEMVAAPQIFKEHLKISCLTQDQLDVFNSNEQFLWVEGPAGSGKTIAMLGKILQLTLYSEKRCLLLIVGRYGDDPAAERHEELFNNIQQDLCQIFFYRRYYRSNDRNKACDLLEAQLNSSSCKIVILVMSDTRLFKNISSLFTSFDYLFVDNFQSLADYIRLDIDGEPSCAHIITDGLLPVVQSAVTNNNTAVWVLCDEGQSWRVIYDRLLNNQHAVITVLDQFRECFRNSKDLAVNLRNTFEISSVLSVIREINNEMDYVGTGPGNLPPQKIGHFLRGTKPVIYLLRDDKPGSWSEIVKRELEKLTGPDSCLDNKDIAMLFSEDGGYHEEQLRATVKSVVQGRRAGTQEEIAVCDVLHCMSAEWPAVIFAWSNQFGSDTATLADNSEKEIKISGTFPDLYIALSRARVHCAMIVFGYKENIDEYADKLYTELRQRQDVCRFIDIPADTDDTDT